MVAAVATRNPPGPKGHFLLGHLPEVKRGVLDFFTQCSRQYGDVVALRFGRTKVALLTGPEQIEQVLVSRHHNFLKHFFAFDLNPRLAGNGLFTSEGDFWLRQRRMMQPAFHHQRIAQYGRVMSTYAERMADTWRDGETRDVHTDMMELTLEVVCKALFDADLSGEARAVGDSLHVVMEDFRTKTNRGPFVIPEAIPTPGNLKVRRAIDRLDEVVYGIVRERRASGEDKGDLLSTLLHLRDDAGSGMTDQQLRDELVTLVVAGHETTAVALSWTWYLLSQHPEVEAKLLDELNTVLNGRTPTVDDLHQLQYTDRVVTESMRLYPPFWALGREVVEECEIGGYRIPAGANILMAQWVVHRDPRFFDDPLTFNPDRWADGLAHRIHRFAYFPFGGGQRLCLGKEFATMEATLVLATMAQQFKLELAPNFTVRPRPTLTLRPRDGMQMVLHARS